MENFIQYVISVTFRFFVLAIIVASFRRIYQLFTLNYRLIDTSIYKMVRKYCSR